MSGGLFSVPLRIKQLTAPSNPSSGSNAIYPKSDDKWYSRNSAGTEVLVGPATGYTAGAGLALTSGTIFSINNNSVTSDMLMDNEIQGTDLRDGAVDVGSAKVNG